MSNKQSSGRRPDYILIAKLKEDGASGSPVGAAWTTAPGPRGAGISIKLNPGVRIGWDDELRLTLWPNVEWAEPAGKKSKKGAPEVDDDSDIPF